MRYPNHFHENTDHPETHEGEQPEQGRHPRGHGRFHRGGAGSGRGPGFGRRAGQGFHPDSDRGTREGSDRDFGHDFGHRGGHGMGYGQRCEQHQGQGHQHRGHNHDGQRPTGRGHDGTGHEARRHDGTGHEALGHEGHSQPGGEPRGGAHRRPTLACSIMKSARRIRQSDLTPEQLHRRIAATVSHADYLTTMRTLRRIGMELRTAPPDSEG